MTLERILQSVRMFDGVLEIAPADGSDFPDIAWGDHFFYFAPDGQVPEREQPYATIVTKNYPDDTSSDLDPPDRWRLNIHVGTSPFKQLTGEDPRSDPATRDWSSVDVVLPHPVHRRQGWVSINNPARNTSEQALRLLRMAHESARMRHR